MSEIAPLELEEEGTIFPLRGAVAEFTRFRGRECLISGGAGTGKTFGILVWIVMLINQYPNLRVLIGRKTRNSMSQTTLVTWETVLSKCGLSHVYASQRREQRSIYVFPNGAEVVVMGFDDPERIKSSEYDVIYINEGTEMDVDDWEIALSRLRNGMMPWQMAVMDCNPGAPTHWVRGRADNGTLAEFVSVHEDNPAYWSRQTQDWTAIGRVYYESSLAGLTGVRKLRLVKGIWAAAEGAVFEDVWDRNRHVIEPKDAPTKYKAYYAGVDWGFQHPGVICLWGVNHDGRLYRVREIYRAGKTIYWWHAQAKRLAQDYEISAWVCDNARPEFIDQWNLSGMFAVEAEKGKGSIQVGLRLVESALKDREDNEPGMIFIKGVTGWYDDSDFYDDPVAADAMSLAEAAREPGRWDHLENPTGKISMVSTGMGDWINQRCQKQLDANRPSCTEDEFYVYAWPKTVEGKPLKEVPTPMYDDGIDTIRYLLRYLQGTVIPDDDNEEPLGIYQDPDVEDMLI